MVISNVICFDTSGNQVPEETGKGGKNTDRELVGRTMDSVGASSCNLCIRFAVSWKK